MQASILSKVEATVFLRKTISGCLEQLIRITVSNNTGNRTSASLRVTGANLELNQELQAIDTGESVHELFVPEQKSETDIKIVLQVADATESSLELMLKPPKHWRVHVVQLSHHDLGYTGLPSNVLSKYVRYLDKAIDMAEETENYPDDAKFRLTLEQQWSLGEFLRVAPPKRVKKMIKLLREGRFELTALFGNMLTEFCGHESLIRTIYPSYRLKKEHGIPIVSAEHNDITGISWGLCRLLTDMDVKIFCPGIPLYYNWSEGVKYQSFWNQEKVFGYNGAPGAFWWEAATGKRLLVYCNNQGCGGTSNPALPELEDNLNILEDKDYRSNIFRFPVQGGGRDNSPYIRDFADTIKEWNEKWEFPHLLCSTNSMFYDEFAEHIPDNLPVHRGELPGQDYPPGIMSIAKPAIMGRNNHQAFLSAEKLATLAESTTDYEYQGYELEEAAKSTLCFEEHACGHTFSQGVAMDGAEAEKAVFAARAAAFNHDVISKASSAIADRIKKEEDGLQLVVFNTLSNKRSETVRFPMRELENSEVIMEETDDKIMTCAALPERRERTRLPLPEEIINGAFELVDLSSGEVIPYQIVQVAYDDPIPYAGQRSGLAQGRKDYFNVPMGIDQDICFQAEKVPAMGYKSYYFRPVQDVILPKKKSAADGSIENEFYLISVDKSAINILDKKSGKTLTDTSAPHLFGDVIIRNPVNDIEERAVFNDEVEIFQGEICSSIKRTGTLNGHPHIKQTLTIYKNSRKIDFDVKILKDSTPLLDVHVAFPFMRKEPEFFYEGTLNVLKPVVDFLPEAYSDRLTVQNYVRIDDKIDKSNSILWCSHDSPIVSLSKLWSGYISPAHSCVQSAKLVHPPQKEEDFKNGWLYSNIFNNNFCTNFSVTQTGEYIFRYSFMLTEQPLTNSESAITGAELMTPLQPVFTSSDYQGELLPEKSFFEIEKRGIILLNCKKAENHDGIILRLWNLEKEGVTSNISCGIPFVEVSTMNHAEEKLKEKLHSENDTFTVTMKANELITILLKTME